MHDDLVTVFIYLVVALLVGCGFLVIAAVMLGGGIPDETDNAGAEEGARINHREVTK